jgi:hypothetical protein
MMPAQQESIEAVLDKIQQLVAHAGTEHETLLLAAGMLNISRQIFEFYLGTDKTQEIMLSQTGPSNDYQQHQLH